MKEVVIYKNIPGEPETKDCLLENDMRATHLRLAIRGEVETDERKQGIKQAQLTIEAIKYPISQGKQVNYDTVYTVAELELDVNDIYFGTVEKNKKLDQKENNDQIIRKNRRLNDDQTTTGSYINNILLSSFVFTLILHFIPGIDLVIELVKSSFAIITGFISIYSGYTGSHRAENGIKKANNRDDKDEKKIEDIFGKIKDQHDLNFKISRDKFNRLIEGISEVAASKYSQQIKETKNILIQLDLENEAINQDSFISDMILDQKKKDKIQNLISKAKNNNDESDNLDIFICNWLKIKEIKKKIKEQDIQVKIEELDSFISKMIIATSITLCKDNNDVDKDRNTKKATLNNLIKISGISSIISGIIRITVVAIVFNPLSGPGMWVLLTLPFLGAMVSLIISKVFNTSVKRKLEISQIKESISELQCHHANTTICSDIENQDMRDRRLDLKERHIIYNDKVKSRNKKRRDNKSGGISKLAIFLTNIEGMASEYVPFAANAAIQGFGFAFGIVLLIKFIPFLLNARAGISKTILPKELVEFRKAIIRLLTNTDKTGKEQKNENEREADQNFIFAIALKIEEALKELDHNDISGHLRIFREDCIHRSDPETPEDLKKLLSNSKALEEYIQNLPFIDESEFPKDDANKPISPLPGSEKKGFLDHITSSERNVEEKIPVPVYTLPSPPHDVDLKSQCINRKTGEQAIESKSHQESQPQVMAMTDSSGSSSSTQPSKETDEVAAVSKSISTSEISQDDDHKQTFKPHSAPVTSYASAACKANSPIFSRPDQKELFAAPSDDDDLGVFHFETDDDTQVESDDDTQTQPGNVAENPAPDTHSNECKETEDEPAKTNSLGLKCPSSGTLSVPTVQPIPDPYNTSQQTMSMFGKPLDETAESKGEPQLNTQATDSTPEPSPRKLLFVSC